MTYHAIEEDEYPNRCDTFKIYCLSVVAIVLLVGVIGFTIWDILNL